MVPDPEACKKRQYESSQNIFSVHFPVAPILANFSQL